LHAHVSPWILELPIVLLVARATPDTTVWALLVLDRLILGEGEKLGQLQNRSRRHPLGIEIDLLVHPTPPYTTFYHVLLP